ncbi:uncharacterized protein LOC128337264 isoform X3 [Hemicordylus capensis]|uniref:uncharacterized protein LOC128337264 isoform X3 n=1 Tax=Hemicordylus capensis TaxID=884348 RepID=UPI0023026A56|nr:uncharacterized protein LOC128337264 isoform X3 [Hemicordylus capensis]
MLRRIRSFFSRRSSRVAPLDAPAEPTASKPAARPCWWCICGRKNQVAPAPTVLPPSLPPVGESSEPGPSAPPVQDAGASTPCHLIHARLQRVHQARTLKEGGGGKERRGRITFLMALIQACQEAIRRGEQRLPFSKGLAAQAVLEEMAYIWDDPVPHHLFSLCTEAIASLSGMKPCLGAKTEQKLISESIFWMSHMIGGEPEEDRESPFLPPERSMRRMLQAMLAEKPTLTHLIRIAKAIDAEMFSEDEEEAAMAENVGFLLLNMAIGPPFYFEAEQIKPLLPLGIRRVGRTTSRDKGDGSHSSDEASSEDLKENCLNYAVPVAVLGVSSSLLLLLSFLWSQLCPSGPGRNLLQ